MIASPAATPVTVPASSTEATSLRALDQRYAESAPSRVVAERVTDAPTSGLWAPLTRTDGAVPGGVASSLHTLTANSNAKSASKRDQERLRKCVRKSMSLIPSERLRIPHCTARAEAQGV